MENNLFTVNVIEMNESYILQLVAFPETVEGNENAEKLFKQMVKENYSDVTDEQMNDCLDEGIFHWDNGGFSVLLVHSV